MSTGNQRTDKMATHYVNKMRLWPKALTLGLAVGALLLLAACGGEEASPTPTGPESIPSPTRAAPTGPKVGGTLVMSLTHPVTLNPALSPVSTTIFTTPLFYNGLTRPGNEMEPLPDLAESWEAEEGGLRYTFHLREGVKWHDGQPFTAEDVKFTWETICHPDNLVARQLCGFFGQVNGAMDYMAGNAQDIAGISIPDPHTVQVEMDSVYAPFITISAGQMIIPKHVWKDVPVQEMGAHPAARGNGTIGTGPFVVDSWTTNEQIISHANLEYYEGRPNLDQFIIRQTSSVPAAVAARVTQMKVGQINAMGLYAALPIDNVEEFENDPNIEVRAVTGLANNYVEFNLRNPLFSDVRVRKAISYATDRRALWDNLWKGRSTFVNGPIHPVFSWAINPNTPLFDNDLGKARDLFAEAGWTPGSDGILQKDGQRFSFTLSGCCGAESYGPILQQQWKQAGADVKLEILDFGSFWGPIYLAQKHEVAGLNLPYGLYTDPEYPMGGYFITARNRSGWKNPRSDELIQLAISTLDQAERQRHYFELQELMANEVPNLWLGIPDEHWTFTKGLVIPEKKTGYLTIRSAKDWYWAK